MGLNTQAQGLVKVSAAILDPADSNQFSYGCVISNKIHLSNCNPILENPDHA